MSKFNFRFKFSTDLVIIAALVLLLFAWGPLYKKFMAPPAAVPVEKTGAPSAALPAETPPPPSPVAAAIPANATGGTGSGTVSVLRAPAPAVEPSPNAVSPDVSSLWLPSGFRVESDPTDSPVILSNAVIQLTLSPRSGGILSAELGRFPLTDHPESGPVVLDFGDRPALAYVNVPGLVPAPGFQVEATATSQIARFTARTPAGLRFERTLSLNDQYEVTVSDTFVNESDQPILMDDHGLQVGPMSLLPGEVRGKADVFFGIDSLATGAGEKVKHWNTRSMFGGGETLADLFQPEARRGGCSMRHPPLGKPLPLEVGKRVNADLEWVAVKNRFFVQILTPAQGGTALDLQTTRWVDRSEDPADSATWMGRAVLKDVSAVAHFGSRNLEPGATVTHEARYFLGPRDYTIIKDQGNHQDKVMEFGIWSLISGILVRSLQWIYQVVPNYGLAIILITLLIRGLFWPITHKGTESMKRMQAIQPLVAELKVKYKDNAQKLQQATMALYKEHKVNPLGGCLPLLIQIPVFIALFNVLRSDIALRFADFLWVRDLSEPENLMMGLLPWGLGLNLLPIYMAATMAWQTHLTPSAGDPAQQKMMMFMPIMMLFFFYTMPSGLVLYWSANQTMMIVQLLWQKQQAKKKAAA
jgi:YidC/Oxa1 family membrane protein insertase